MGWSDIEVFVTDLPLKGENGPIVEFLERRGFEVNVYPGRVLTKPMACSELRETPKQLMANLRRVVGEVPNIQVGRFRAV